MKEVKRDRGNAMNVIDRVISFVSPAAGLQRMHARARMDMAGGYYSRDRGKRPFNSWGLSGGSADTEIMRDLPYLRSDSRDLQRKSPLALGAINTVVTNVVGPGLTAQSSPDEDTLIALAGVTKKDIDLFIEQSEREFDLWANNTACDASRTQKFTGLQDLVFRSMLESGDVFALRRQIPRKGVGLQTCIQVLEADRVDNPNRRADTADCAGGITRNEYGEPTFYNVLAAHPGNHFVTADQFKTVPYPAFLPNGEWNVLHLFKKLRPEQTRGVPYLAPVIQSLKELTQYSEAEIKAAVVSALFTVFVKTESGDGLPASKDPNKKGEISLGAGAIVDLSPGEEIEFANPSRPNANFDPFYQAVTRQIGVALELPFEVLIKHFTASYSAAQAALLEAWKFFKVRRTWLQEYFCDPVREAVLSEGVGRGRIKAPGFFSDPIVRAAWLKCDWTGAPRGSIDPTKEVAAAEIMEDRGWKTAQENTAELTGGDFDRKHKRRLREAAMRSELPQPAPTFQRPVPNAQTDTPQQENSPNDQPEKS